MDGRLRSPRPPLADIPVDAAHNPDGLVAAAAAAVEAVDYKCSLSSLLAEGPGRDS